MDRIWTQQDWIYPCSFDPLDGIGVFEDCLRLFHWTQTFKFISLHFKINVFYRNMFVEQVCWRTQYIIFNTEREIWISVKNISAIFNFYSHCTCILNVHVLLRSSFNMKAHCKFIVLIRFLQNNNMQRYS